MTVWFYMTIGGVGFLLACLGMAISAPRSATRGVTIALLLVALLYAFGAILLTIYIEGK